MTSRGCADGASPGCVRAHGVTVDDGVDVNGVHGLIPRHHARVDGVGDERGGGRDHESHEYVRAHDALTNEATHQLP